MAKLSDYIKVMDKYSYCRESNATDDIIINLYNSQRPSGSYKMGLSEPWCHAYISACSYEAGCTSIIPNTCYCPTGINWSKSKGRWVGRYDNNYNPTKGDIIYYDWGGDGVSDHVGCVISRSGNDINVKEGNINDKVETRVISIYSSYIQGYHRPNYDDKSSIVDTTVESRNWLQNGDTGTRVKELQEKLIYLGYSCGSYGVDGDYGNGTELAVRKFQGDNGLVTDGQAGELTFAKLNNLYNTKKAEETDKNSNVPAFNGSYIGKATKMFESGNLGPECVEHCGNDGGLSYGTYQFIWSWGGEPASAQTFWNKYYAAKYGKATSYTDLKNKWLKAVKDDRTTFIDNEWEYVLNGGEYYSQALKALKGFFDPDTYSEALQHCVWSWAIHRGGYSSAQEFKKACSNAGITKPQSYDETKLLNALYDYRWNNITYNGKKLTRYSPNGGSSSERVAILKLVGKKPLPYYKPSGILSGGNSNASGGSTGGNTPSNDTDNWIYRLQLAVGATADNIAGPETLSKCPLLKYGSRGSIVQLVQERLITKFKINVGRYDADGDFGDCTESGVKTLQGIYGKNIEVDGEVGNDTWSILLGLK